MTSAAALFDRTGAPRAVQCPLGAPFAAAVAFSPTGQRLAYARPEPTGAYSIVVSTLGGKIVAERAERVDTPTAIAWAPSGSRLAYTSGPELHVVDTIDRLVFRANAPLELGGWLPNGDGIVVSAGTLPAAKSYFVDPAGGTPRELGAGAHAATSPDGTRVAVVVSVPSPTDVIPGRSQHIQVIDLASGGRTTVFPSQAPIDSLAWSPDSRQIAFLWDIDIEPDLMAQNADGSSTGLFGRAHGALPTQIGMVAPIRWTQRGIVGAAPAEEGTSTLAFYDVATGRARNRVMRYATRIAAVSTDGARVAYFATAVDTPRTDAAGLRLVGWKAGGSDRTLTPCRGTRGNDRIRVAAAPTTVLAGRGNDLVDSRNNRRDVVDCGPGTDTALDDPRDVIRRCEHVTPARP